MNTIDSESKPKEVNILLDLQIEAQKIASSQTDRMGRYYITLRQLNDLIVQMKARLHKI